MSTPHDPPHPGAEQQDAQHQAVTDAPTLRPRNTLPTTIGIAIAVVVLAAVGIFVWQSQTTDTVNADVGDCITVATASLTDAKTEQIDCAALAASYVVTETGDSVNCDPDETSFAQGDDTVCLRPNLNAGDCITPKTTNDDTFQKIECSQATAADSTVRLVDTSVADASKCAEGSEPVLLTERAVTYCLSAMSG